MFEIFLIILVWLGIGYVCGEFIIRWNQCHLLGNPDRKKIAIADLFNVNLKLAQDTNISILRVYMALTAPFTLPKAAVLRVWGGPAIPKSQKKEV